jgi:hypothetical protein
MATDKDRKQEQEQELKEWLNTSFVNPKIGVIIHTYSSTKSKFPLNSNDLRKLVGDEGLVIQTHSKKDIYHALAEFRYQRVAFVGFLGDNRSIHYMITTLIDLHGEDKMPFFFPLKSISKSIISGEVNLDKDPGVIINRIKKNFIEKKINPDDIKYIIRPTLKVTIREENKSITETKDTITEQQEKRHIVERVNKKADHLYNAFGDDIYYGFFFGFGAIYRIMKLYYEGDEKVAKSVKSFSRTYLSFLFNGDLADHLLSKDLCSIQVKSPRRAGLENIDMPRCSLTLASSIDRILDNYKPFNNISRSVSNNDDTFNFMTANLNRGDILKGLPFFIKGKYGKLEKEEKVKSERVNLLYIKTNAGLLLDGELIKHYDQNKTYIITIEKGPVIKFPVI